MDFSNTYVHLDNRFYEKSNPTPVQDPRLLLWNPALADQLKISSEEQKDHHYLAQIFSGNKILSGSEPIATAYAGHQFGNFNPQLGDGRAHLLGEVIDQQGVRWDLQLKGSGPTPYSRGGDGRCGIGPAVREFIMSEAMMYLAVPTTQCLAVVATGESVYRKTAVPGAVVTRVASSHLRVGTFQFFAARGDKEAVKMLCDYAIEKHYPELLNEKEDKYVALVDKVIEKQIQLIVEWMRVGFIHGVMNTDNTAISGDTIDFGPCAMMSAYNPKTVYSSIDHRGRYAFGNQPDIASWNMARFAECMLLLIDEGDTQTTERLETLVGNFITRFKREYLSMMARKFGLESVVEGDEAFISSLLEQFTAQELDYTITFDLMTKSLTSDSITNNVKKGLGPYFESWRKRIDEQEAPLEDIQKLMREQNPVVIPRNHHIEAVIQECEATGDIAMAEEILSVIRNPYTEMPNTSKYQDAPDDGDQQYQTFCGT